MPTCQPSVLPPVHEGFYMMRWLTCSTHTIHYHMYTG